MSYSGPAGECLFFPWLDLGDLRFTACVGDRLKVWKDATITTQKYCHTTNNQSIAVEEEEEGETKEIKDQAKHQVLRKQQDTTQDPVLKINKELNPPQAWL